MAPAIGVSGKKLLEASSLASSRILDYSYSQPRLSVSFSGQAPNISKDGNIPLPPCQVCTILLCNTQPDSPKPQLPAAGSLVFVPTFQRVAAASLFPASGLGCLQRSLCLSFSLDCLFSLQGEVGTSRA